MKRLVVGVLAHVDSGKTTLSEALLYRAGSIRKLGRVDHRDAFLDTDALEKARGITIFAKQAVLTLPAGTVTGTPLEETQITLLDTPGHVDFSAEAERTLQVLDYAVLVISGTDGIQSHTMTLWRLLERYHVPTFIYVNKMDLPGADKALRLRELRGRFGDGCVDFTPTVPAEERAEALGVCSEPLMEAVLATGTVPQADLITAITRRQVFPCYFGAALRLDGIDDLLNGLQRDTRMPPDAGSFGARIFKIGADESGARMTYLKVTDGVLKVKSNLVSRPDARVEFEEKADQLRVYSGSKYRLVSEAPAGTVCAVLGPTKTYPGQGLGVQPDARQPMLEPVLNYRVDCPDADPHTVLRALQTLEDEDPQLHVAWRADLAEVHVQLMGEVQTEILQSLVKERFDVDISFGSGNIVYKETIKNTVEGVGHFEPLRHYAEVHLLLEPGEPGSGLQFFTACSEDVLDRNWQRLILTHLEEREHPGVLTGSPITDMQITLITGRAHLKHTEGGDFRQATYRAVRQGLKKAKSVLLEPYYEFRLEIPGDMIGRAMTDIQKMNGTFQQPEADEDDMMVLKGSAPVSMMRDYQTQVTSYTKGRGRLFCSLKGYAPCQNQDEIVEEIGYDSERDLDNPTGSVFCAHGAGFVVPWYEVEDYMHLEGIDESELGNTIPDSEESIVGNRNSNNQTDSGYRPPRNAGVGSYEDEEELKAIFERTFGPVKRYKEPQFKRTFSAKSDSGSYYRNSSSAKKKEKEYLLVDGYNIIYAWEDLKELADANLHAAQTKLMDILSNYQGFKKCTLILVFDAYKIEGHAEEVITYHNIHVVYTKEAETADQYIEKTVHKIGRENQVTVATSDGLEQIIIMGQGAHRMSARGLRDEIKATENQIRQQWHEKRQSSKNYLIDNISDEMAQYMKKEKSPTPSEDSASITALLLENERLRTALKHEKLRAQAYDTMIDVAEEMFNIPIRKKAGTKQ